MFMDKQATPSKSILTKKDTVKGRVIYLLILISALHFIYPITIGGNTAALILFQVLFVGMIGVGTLIASDNRVHLVSTATLGLLWFIFAVIYALDLTNLWKVLTANVFLFLFVGEVVYLLVLYIFSARKVTRDVLYAAITVYISLAALFVPLYSMMERIRPGAFLDNVTGQPIFWQQLTYFSLVTITTAGYGDIVPVSPWARSLANLEMVVGVLYIAILMARLVSLYSNEQ